MADQIIIEGAQGIAGPSVETEVSDFEQTFSASAEWIVNHNLGRFPLVTVLTEGNAEIEADVVHLTVNQFRVYFKVATAGRVRCI